MFLQIYTEFSQKRLGFDCVTRGITIQMIFAILRCMQEGTVSNKAREGNIFEALRQSVKLEAEVSDYNVDKQIYYNQ